MAAGRGDGGRGAWLSPGHCHLGWPCLAVACGDRQASSPSLHGGMAGCPHPRCMPCTLMLRHLSASHDASPRAAHIARSASWQAAASHPPPPAMPRRLAPAAYVEGIRMALSAGGCCASRSSFAGACLGALCGLEGVPDSWRAKYSASQEVAAAAEVLAVKLRQ